MREILYNLRHGLVCALLLVCLKLVPKGEREREILIAFGLLAKAYSRHEPEVATCRKPS